MTVKIIVKGAEKVVARLRYDNAAVTVAAKQAISEATFYVEGEVKKSISGRGPEVPSVDTGAFLRSVESDVQGTTGKVFSDIHYAKYLEYGTSKIGARRHFRNTSRRTRPRVKELINSAVQKAIK